MTPIPKSALPIVEYIRKNVERPKEKTAKIFIALLLYREIAFPFSDLIDWLNDQTDPQAAVNAIWNEEKSK